MQSFEVVGIRRRECISKSTGNAYTGVNLYLEYSDSHVDGLCCVDVFTTADRVPVDVKVGSSVYLIYNRFGRIEAVEHVKK